MYVLWGALLEGSVNSAETTDLVISIRGTGMARPGPAIPPPTARLRLRLRLRCSRLLARAMVIKRSLKELKVVAVG